jgi:hypothetical protein
MKYVGFLSLVCAILVGCAEEESQIDEFNDLLPLEIGAYWQFESNSDDAVWEIDVDAGAGMDGNPSYDYSFTIDGAPAYYHDLIEGTLGSDYGWYEVLDEPERPDLFLILPAEEGVSWTHDYAVKATTYHWEIGYEGRADVSVPAGDFDQAWEVVRAYDQIIDGGADEHHQIYTEYYAPGHGLIKSVIQETDGSQTVIELVEYDLPSAAEEEGE